MSPTWVQSSLSSTFSFVTSLVHMLGFTRVPGYSNGRRSFWILKESSALIPGPRGERWCGDSSSPVADIEQSLVFVSSGDRQSRMVAFFPSSGLYTHFPQNPWAGLWLNRRKEFVNESWSTSSSSLPSDIRRLAKEMQLQPSIEVILRQRPTFWRGGAERPLNTAGLPPLLRLRPLPPPAVLSLCYGDGPEWHGLSRHSRAALWIIRLCAAETW
ncbi:uncharacterized protein [Paralichthys olivaceus]|uniref:uncharacterized protein isoform X3 n=1 Tax=Paralichthys olivaceus TaxID=8255 RepID=UPI0037508D0B